MFSFFFLSLSLVRYSRNIFIDFPSRGCFPRLKRFTLRLNFFLLSLYVRRAVQVGVRRKKSLSIFHRNTHKNKMDKWVGQFRRQKFNIFENGHANSFFFTFSSIFFPFQLIFNFVSFFHLNWDEINLQHIVSNVYVRGWMFIQVESRRRKRKSGKRKS